MSWIAFCSDAQAWVDPSIVAARITGRDTTLPEGTLRLDTLAPRIGQGPSLVRLARPGGRGDGVISLQWVPGMGVVLLITEGRDAWSLQAPLTQVPDRLSLSLTWSARKARLVLDEPGGPVFALAERADPLPLRLSDGYALKALRPGDGLGAGVRQVALARTTMPIGPLPMLPGDTLIDTAQGTRPLSRLRPGDTVRSWRGELVPVLHVVRHEAPAIGEMRPVLLRGAALGLDSDRIVAAGQTLLLRSDAMRDQFGHPAVRIRAGDLPPPYCLPLGEAGDPPLESYAQLVLPKAEPVMSRGLALDTLSFASLRKCWPRFALGLLGDCPWHRLPDHGPSQLPLVQWYELARLRGLRAA